jgi:hypothetical protein
MKIFEVLQEAQAQSFSPDQVAKLFAAEPKFSARLNQIWDKAKRPTDFKNVYDILAKAKVPPAEINRIWRQTLSNPTQSQGPETNNAFQQHDAKQHDLAPGVQIVSQEPIVIKYRNKDFSLNDQGQWIAMASGKIPHQSFREFLNSQHDASLGLASSKPATAQPAGAPVATTLSPEQIRQQKQKQAVQVAQKQLGKNPQPTTPPITVAPQAPKTTVPQQSQSDQEGQQALRAVKGPAGTTGTPVAKTEDNTDYANFFRDTPAAKPRYKIKGGKPEQISETVDLSQVLWNKIKRAR